MNVLIACEFSGIVREAFKAKGHNAWSCDLLDTEIPGQHIKGDVLEVLEGKVNGISVVYGWDLMIAHPPCTNLAVSGAKHFYKKAMEQEKDLDFIIKLMDAPIEKICIENPVSIISTRIRKPDQIIQPYFFGDEFQKTTCIWLKNLPLLQHFAKDDLFNKKTHVGKGDFYVSPSGKKLPKWYSDNKDSKNRSKTFQGIANAMAEQWG